MADDWWQGTRPLQLKDTAARVTILMALRVRTLCVPD